MQGTNKLELNEASLIEAVQYWLTNKVWGPDAYAPTVTRIEPTTAYGATQAFILTLESNSTKGQP